ncbi:MAG TPA: translocation/assembly module TamB domain-containing protein [Thermohalobaculum sp.]|nr:translocation/assembly module TamB domain-containing protein [Thermohalobaculum sp.]
MRGILITMTLAALLAVFVLQGGARAQISLPSIKNKLIELALDQISSPGSFEITAGSIEDSTDGLTSLVDVKVSDGEGIWLTLERLSFSWMPDRLFSGELAINRLELIGLAVLRPLSENAEAPELEPSEPSTRGIFDWPRSPISLSIEGVRLERVTIADGVLPQAISFDADGRAVDKDDLQELALTLRRTDDVAGEITLSMRRDFATNTLKLAIAAHEAPGGMVATAAGFPLDAPARLELTADGPPEEWRLDFIAAVERTFEAQGQAILAYAERLSVDADFSVTPGPELSDRVRTILGDQARLRAQVIERPDGMIEVVSGELSSRALTLNGSGVLATGPGNSDLTISLEALAPLAALADGVTFERFTFDGKVAGPQGGLEAVGTLGLSGMTTALADAQALTLDGTVLQIADGLTFNLDGKGEGIRIDRISPEVIVSATLRASGKMDGVLLTLTDAAIDAPVLNATASGTYDVVAGTGNLNAGLVATDVSTIASAYDVTATGGVNASADVILAGERITAEITAALTEFGTDPVSAEKMTLSGQVSQETGLLAFDLTGAGQELILDQIPRDLTRAFDLKARGQIQEGTLALESLQLVSPLVSAEVSGSLALDDRIMALEYSMATAEFAPVAQAYGVDAMGVLEASGQAEGGFTTPRIAGRVSIAGAGFDGRSYGAVTVSHDVVLGDLPEGSLSLESRGGALGAADAAAQFRLDGAALTLTEMRAKMQSVSLSGRAVVDLETNLIDGAFDVSSADIAPAGRFLGANLGGGARGQVVMTPSNGRQNLTADLNLTHLSTDGVSIAKADLRLRADDAFGTPRLDARLDANGLVAGNLDLAMVRASANGPLRQIKFSADAEGAVGEYPLAATASGRADASGPVVVVTLDDAEIVAGPDSIRLRQPLALRVGGGTVQATGIDIALPGEGSLAGDLAQRPGGFAGDVTLVNLQLAVLDRWDVVPVIAGQLDLQASFDTLSGRASGEVTAQARGVIFERVRAGIGGLDIDIDAGWDGKRLDAKAELRGDFGDPVRARLAAPLQRGRGGIPEFSSKGALDGAVTWAGDLGDLWALVPAPGHILDGRTDIDLRLGGSLDAPSLSGRIELTDGGYQNLDAGTILSDLTIRSEIIDDRTVTLTVDGSDGAKGKISSRIALKHSGAEPSINGTIRIDRAVMVRRDDVTAQITGDLALDGPMSNLALNGQLKVDQAEVRLVNALPPEVIDLAGIRITGEPEPETDENGNGILTLDIAITAPRNIFVRGRGLDSEWKMDLAVAGDAAAPVITGAIEKMRGEIDLLGEPFDLVRGRVTFDGGREIDPLIDVSLELEANDIRGGIQVGGRASAPELHFASTPALPEDEVLPRLLFGQSRQSLTGAQAIQMALGVATLLGGGGGPLDAVRKATGLDVLRVDGESVEDASVTVGRNVAKGVFIGARQGLGGQGSAVTVEVEVFDGVVVDTEFGPEQGSNIGITLQRDF